MLVKKHQLDTDMEQWMVPNWEKNTSRLYIDCHPVYVTYIWVHHVKCQAGWSTDWNPDTTLIAESKGEWKSPMMKVKEESEKAVLKLNIQKTKIMASAPITSWKTEGETRERMTNFIFLCSKIIADGDCSHEIKRCLLLGRKAMTNLDSILKSRDIADKYWSSQGYFFSSGHVWMWKLDH